jgi:L-lactate dehydrogenase complex protein LldF
VAARDQAVAEVSNWEDLRRRAREIKAHTLSFLSYYLGRLEARVAEQGGRVVWAETAREAVDFVVELAYSKAATKAVKSKSMLGEEIGLNESLAHAHIQPVETDLGEYIVQLAGETPSHLVIPALHKSRQEVADLFVEKLGMAPTEDVEQITLTARRVLREHFLSARLGVTGVNFAVAENGAVVVVENEGNARLSVSVPEIHVALMGIEKVVPRVVDLAVFLKLLTRNATGQKVSTYVDMISGPRRAGEIDGPGEFYLVLIDNGRSRILADEYLRQTLYCIRCGACLDSCPVYQKVGGHAYRSTYQGPIGAILTPQLSSAETAAEHPFASSLCCACADICPVKIDIPRILLRLRAQVQEERNARALRAPVEKWGMTLWSRLMGAPAAYRWFSRLARLAQAPFRRGDRLSLPFPPFRAWTKSRELPPLASRTFRAQFEERSIRALERGSRREA